MQLKEGVRYFLAPLGIGDLLAKWGVAEEKITQLDWWQSTDVGAIHFVARPSQHFSGQGLFDGNKRLWCSWSIITDKFRLFFSGGSGYFPGFKEIGNKYGPFDVACLENGAYDRRWADIHMLPANTIQAFQNLKEKWLMPIHNAAFDLAFYHWNDSFKQILALACDQKIKLSLPVIGQAVNILAPQEEAVWWESDMVGGYLRENSRHSRSTCGTDRITQR